MFCKIKKFEQPTCPFCKAEDETYIHRPGKGGDNFRSFLIPVLIFLVFCHKVPSLDS